MNRKMIVGMCLVMVVLTLMVNCATAGRTADPQIQDRIHEQQTRIDEGIRNGQLTRAEADVLQDNLNWIKETEARLKADGRLTPQERKRLHKMLDDNSDMILKKRHNKVRRLY